MEMRDSYFLPMEMSRQNLFMCIGYNKTVEDMFQTEKAKRVGKRRQLQDHCLRSNQKRNSSAPNPGDECKNTFLFKK